MYRDIMGEKVMLFKG